MAKRKGKTKPTTVRLGVPPGVYVEDIDVTMVLEKAAFFARQQGEEGCEQQA